MTPSLRPFSAVATLRGSPAPTARLGPHDLGRPASVGEGSADGEPPVWEIRCHDPGAGLEPSLRGPWLALWEQRAADHLQLHPDWIALAAAHEPGVVVVTAEGPAGLAAVLPLRRSRLLRRGAPVALALCDSDGMVAGPEGPPIEALLRAAGVRSLFWGHAPPEADPLRPHRAAVHEGAVVRLGGSFEAWAAATRAGGSRVVSQTARKHRKLEREVGRVSIRHDHSDLETAEALVRAKVGQLALRWAWPLARARWAPGLIAASTRAAGGVRGVLSTLRAGDRVLAWHWGLRAGPTVVSVVPAYDPAASRWSPGTVLMIDLLERLAAEGVERVVLGQGIDQTKRRLMTHTEPLATGWVETSALSAGIHRAWDRLVPVARSVRARLRGR